MNKFHQEVEAIIQKLEQTLESDLQTVAQTKEPETLKRDLQTLNKVTSFLLSHKESKKPLRDLRTSTLILQALIQKIAAIDQKQFDDLVKKLLKSLNDAIAKEKKIIILDEEKDRKAA